MGEREIFCAESKQCHCAFSNRLSFQNYVCSIIHDNNGVVLSLAPVSAQFSC